MKKCRFFSSISLFIFLIAIILAAYSVFRSGLLPMRLSIIGLILLGVVLLLLSLLVFSKRSRFLTIAGGVLCLIFSVVLLAGGVVLYRTVNTAQGKFSSETRIEVASVGVYMLADKTTESTALDADMSYGILEHQDRKNTDEALSRLKKELGKELMVDTFDGPTELLDALLDGQVDAIVLNSAFLDLVDELSGYENVSEKLRSVSKIRIEREVPVKETAPRRQTETPAVGSSANPEEPARAFAVYISGIDNRGKLIEKSRSDVNIVAVVNPESHQVLLITTPRDYYVPLKFEDYISPKDKLTHAGIYGVQVSMDTLGMLYDMEFDYYFRINFDGFVDFVEALGGVTVEVEKEFGTTEYFFPAGPNYLNGYKALSFVRNRFGIGDQQRGRNQMAFIKGVINKALSTDMLLNFNSVLNSVEGCFETSMPYEVISALVRDQIETGADWNVVTYAVTGSGNSAIPYSMNFEVYVMDPDMETVEIAKDLIQKAFDGEVLVQP